MSLSEDSADVHKRSMISLLETAASLFNEAGLFETAVLAWEALVTLYCPPAPSTLQKLSLCHGNIR
jgi:hypothetical protein